MFNALTEKFEKTFRNLRGLGRISEKNIEEAIRDIRMNLLAADVNVKVVKAFLANISQKAMGQEVLGSLKPAEQFVKIVHTEMTDLLGGQAASLPLAVAPPLVMMLVGLQGSGKTTTVAKLAHYLKGKGRTPLLVPADLARPAAVEQLTTLGEALGLPVMEAAFSDPVEKVNASRERAKQLGCDTILVDTAGRLHIDETLMNELSQMRSAVVPHTILYVLDAMAGQDALTAASQFNEQLSFDGVILTKLDGDARGGSALSVGFNLQKPIYFAGVGEKIEALEPFYPDRMASRILGMGDVLSLVEEVQKEINPEQVEKAKRLFSADFSLFDFRDQLESAKKVDKMDKWMGMLPGGRAMLSKLNVNFEEVERDIRRKMAIIDSMTHLERAKPKILNGSRRKRIAKGSGTDVSDVNRLLKEFEQVKTMMKNVKQRGGLRHLFGSFGGK